MFKKETFQEDKPVESTSNNYPIIRDQTDHEEEREIEFEKSESDSEMRGRLRSHDSINSNPKSWHDFEEENRSWRVSDQSLFAYHCFLSYAKAWVNMYYRGFIFF